MPTTISPNPAYAGQAVTLAATTLTGVSSVKFGDVEASFAYYDASSHSIIAYPNLCSSGDVVATFSGSTDTWTGFVFKNEPAYVPYSTDIITQFCTGSDATSGDTITYY